MTLILILLIIKILCSYLRLHSYINDQNTRQRKNFNLPYTHCYTRNICEKLEGRDFIRKRMYSLVNVEN